MVCIFFLLSAPPQKASVLFSKVSSFWPKSSFSFLLKAKPCAGRRSRAGQAGCPGQGWKWGPRAPAAPLEQTCWEKSPVPWHRHHAGLVPCSGDPRASPSATLTRLQRQFSCTSPKRRFTWAGHGDVAALISLSLYEADLQ